MGADNTLELVVQIDATRANKEIKGVNANLSGLEEQVVVSTKKGSSGFSEFENATARSSKEVRQATAAAQILGSEIGLNLPRSVRRMIGESQALGSALTAAFEVTAFVAVGVAVYEMGKKFAESQGWLGKSTEEMKKAREEADKFTESLMKSANQYARIGLSGPALRTMDVAQATKAAVDASARLNEIRALTAQTTDKTITGVSKYGPIYGPSPEAIAAKEKLQKMGIDEKTAAEELKQLSEKQLAAEGELANIKRTAADASQREYESINLQVVASKEQGKAREIIRDILEKEFNIHAAIGAGQFAAAAAIQAQVNARKDELKAWEAINAEQIAHNQKVLQFGIEIAVGHGPILKALEEENQKTSEWVDKLSEGLGINVMNEAIIKRMNEQWELAKQIQSDTLRDDSQNQIASLKTRQEIVQLRSVGMKADKYALEQRSAADDYEIKSAEIMLAYKEKQRELEVQIANIKATGTVTPELQAAWDARQAQLDIDRDRQLTDAAEVRDAKIFRAQEEKGIAAVQKIRDAAGHLWDDALSSSNSLWEGVWKSFKNIFLAPARIAFQDLAQYLFTGARPQSAAGAGGGGGLLSRIFPSFGSGGGGGEGWSPGSHTPPGAMSFGGGGGGGGFGGFAGGSGGGGIFGLLGGLFGKHGGSPTSLSQAVTNIPGNENLPTSPGGFGAGLKGTGLVGMGGMLLAMGGLKRGGISGLGMTTAGGAMIGWQYGGYLGAAIGAGIGAVAGIIRLFFKGAADKVREKVKATYGVDIKDKGVLNQIADMAKQSFGGNIDMAIQSPDVRDLIELYAMTTGQKTASMPAKMTPLSLVQSGGSLSQQASYSNGSLMSPLPGAGLDKIGAGVATAAGAPMVINISVPGAKDFFQKETVSVIVNQPKAVQTASVSATAKNFNRRELTALQLSPGTLTS